MNSVYVPTGKAKEYGDYALNIFEGCSHGCVYCFAPSVLKKDREEFHSQERIRIRVGNEGTIVDATRKWFASKPDVKGKHIHLCFTCDPFPTLENKIQQSVFHQITFEIMDIIHESGNFVQILTKGNPGVGVFKHLVKEDIYGVTISCGDHLAPKIEPNAEYPSNRLQGLKDVKRVVGCKTFVSCEPVFQDETVFELIRNYKSIDEFKIGKLNYMAKDNPLYPNINWGEFGKHCEELCREHNRIYYIKEGLRKEMGE